MRTNRTIENDTPKPFTLLVYMYDYQGKRIPSYLIVRTIKSKEIISYYADNVYVSNLKLYELSDTDAEVIIKYLDKKYGITPIEDDYV